MYTGAGNGYGGLGLRRGGEVPGKNGILIQTRFDFWLAVSLGLGRDDSMSLVVRTAFDLQHLRNIFIRGQFDREGIAAACSIRAIIFGYAQVYVLVTWGSE